jgi:hypothetical protein
MIRVFIVFRNWTTVGTTIIAAESKMHPPLNIESCTFEEAQDKGRQENWAMTPEERIALCEHLRRTFYGDRVYAPIQRVFDADEPAPRGVYDHRRLRG